MTPVRTLIVAGYKLNVLRMQSTSLKDVAKPNEVRFVSGSRRYAGEFVGLSRVRGRTGWFLSTFAYTSNGIMLDKPLGRRLDVAWVTYLLITTP